MGTTTHELGTGPEGLGAVDSCRLDWLSVSFFAATGALQKEQIRYWLELNALLSGTYELVAGGGRRFFEESWYHPCGIALKWTEPNSGSINQGLLSVDMKGDALASLPAAIRKSIYMDIAEFEGFKQATRIDTQRTVVNPHATADQIHQKVLAREVWIKGYSGWRPGGLQDVDGRPINGCTITFGSPKGTTCVKTYDKRAELKGVGDPAVRHECVQRKQVARDRFQSLVKGLHAEGDTETTDYETRFCQSNLAQAMTYLDTSRLKDIPRDQWPDNWARDSKPADFWSQVVNGPVEEFTTQWRYERTLERLIINRAKQYGRGRIKYLSLRIFRDGESLKDCQQDDLDLDFIRLKDEDIDEVVAQVPAERREECRAWMVDGRHCAAENIEHAHNNL